MGYHKSQLTKDEVKKLYVTAINRIAKTRNLKIEDMSDRDIVEVKDTLDTLIEEYYY